MTKVKKNSAPPNATSANVGYEAEVRKHGHVLTPGRYVGAEAQEDDGEPCEEKMKQLKLDAAIAANLRELGYGG